MQFEMSSKSAGKRKRKKTESISTKLGPENDVDMQSTSSGNCVSIRGTKRRRTEKKKVENPQSKNTTAQPSSETKKICKRSNVEKPSFNLISDVTVNSAQVNGAKMVRDGRKKEKNPSKKTISDIVHTIETSGTKKARRKRKEIVNSSKVIFNGNLNKNHVSTYTSSETNVFNEGPYLCAEKIKSVIKDKISIDISDEISQMLLSCADARLRDVIKTSVLHMKICGREMFTLKDFNKGLTEHGESPYSLCGTFVKKNVGKKHIQAKTEVAHSQISVSLAGGRDCIQTKIPNKSKKMSNTKVLSKSPSSYFNSYTCSIDRDWLENYSCSKNDLPEELKTYFETIKNILTCEKGLKCLRIFNDFETNKNIDKLIPHFVNFLCYTLEKHILIKQETDFVTMYIHLRAVESLLLNPVLNFHNVHLYRLVHTVMKLLLVPLPFVNNNYDCWSLKNCAASIIELIFKQITLNEFLFDVIHDIHLVLRKAEISMFSLYGAFSVLNSMGVLAISLMIPDIERRCFKLDIEKVRSYQAKCGIIMVLGQMIQLYYILIKHHFAFEFKRPSKLSNLLLSSSNLKLPFEVLQDINVFPISFLKKSNELFGDRLVPFFPSLPFASFKANLRKKICLCQKKISKKLFQSKIKQKKQSYFS